MSFDKDDATCGLMNTKSKHDSGITGIGPMKRKHENSSKHDIDFFQDTILSKGQNDYLEQKQVSPMSHDCAMDPKAERDPKKKKTREYLTENSVSSQTKTATQITFLDFQDSKNCLIKNIHFINSFLFIEVDSTFFNQNHSSFLKNREVFYIDTNKIFVSEKNIFLRKDNFMDIVCKFIANISQISQYPFRSQRLVNRTTKIKESADTLNTDTQLNSQSYRVQMDDLEQNHVLKFTDQSIEFQLFVKQTLAPESKESLSPTERSPNQLMLFLIATLKNDYMKESIKDELVFIMDSTE
jgi:hypothetical protein